MYISDGCKTPITEHYDNDDDGKSRTTACNEIEHAAMAYHNYHTWYVAYPARQDANWRALTSNLNGFLGSECGPTRYTTAPEVRTLL